MAIELEVPIVVPEKTADKVWILNMVVSAPTPDRQVYTSFVVAPYVSSTGEILIDQQQTINIPDTLTACADNATLANALGSIYAAVENLCRQNNLFGLSIEE